MAEIAFNENKAQCAECGGSGAVVVDHSTGDMVCTGCGLVLESHCLDEGQEWRNFKDEGVGMGAKTCERERADRASGKKDGDFGELSGTGIIGSNSMAQSLRKMQTVAERASAAPVTKANRMLKNYTEKVREEAGRLMLNEGIVQRCISLLSALSNKNELRQGMRQAWINGIIYLACKEERSARTFRELAHANASFAGKREAEFEKQIHKSVLSLGKLLADVLREGHTPHHQTEELIARFVSRLQLSQEVSKPAVHITQQASRYGLVGSQRQSAVIASSIYIVAWLLDVEPRLSLADVASIARVPETIVKNAYTALRPHTRHLIPSNFVCRLAGGLDSLPTAAAKR